MGETTRRQSLGAAAQRHLGLAWWSLATVLGGAALLFCYLRIAGATQVNSDGAGLVLQASDMLHGNLLLHGWWDTDVSFITTELPEYMGVTAAAGVRPEVVHVCSALTYTLLVLLAAFVARGRARGAEGIVRALLAATVMLAPQPNGPTVVLLGSPDHVGTAVPLLVLLLLLDRVQPPRSWARWLVPVCVTVLLAWTIVGDALAEVLGVVPLALACLLRAGRIIIAARRGGASTGAWRAAAYDLSLAAAAVIAVPVAYAVNSLIRRLGGYRLGPATYHPLPWHRVAQDAPLLWQSVLALFGADYAGVTGAGNVAFALAHLAGVAVVLAAVAVAAWRLIRPSRSAPLGDLAADVLVLAVVVNIAAYLFVVPIDNIYSAHEIGPVMALGAALAGRMLGGPLLRFRPSRLRLPGPRRGFPVLLPVLAAALACYVLLLGVAAASPQRMPQNVHLATWLRQHHLSSGLAPYWQASSVTVDSGGAVTMVAVAVRGRNHRLEPYPWESDGRLADPATHTANFMVIVPGPVTGKLAVKTFGKPARTYRYQSYLILVWRKNLLAALAPSRTPAR
ncbi:MAG TPA: hypothetical protein VF838_17745 [Trebonia sp.]